MTYLKNFAQTPVAQKERLSADQVQNSAGGFVFAVDKWQRLNRFLILGSEGGSFYANERELTRENANCVTECLAENAERTIDTIVSISDAGRAPKNDQALFALAMAASSADEDCRRLALNALPRVARIPTHLFDFMTYLTTIRSGSHGGRMLRTALANWYNTKTTDSVAYTMSKYRQRNGWKHRDIFRLAHIAPKTNGTHDDIREDIYRWAITDGWAEIGEGEPTNTALLHLWAFEKAQRATSAKEVVSLLGQYPNLSREMIPTAFLNDASVQEALLMNGMPLEAMIRNLGNMSASGLLAPMSKASKYIVERLSDADALHRARIHPIKVLSALMTYKSGHGLRGSNVWTPVTKVTDALDAAFYLAFANVEPSGKNHLLALDVSGSMEWSSISGMPGLTPRDGAAAMSLITAAVEPETVIVAFASGTVGPRNRIRASGEGITVLDISPKMRLDEVIRKTQGLYAGGTDCSLPMRWAKENKVKVDIFCTYTDSETWAGPVHPTVALEDYRKSMNVPDAKNAVIAMLSNGFAIANPSDPNQMDFVGFDTTTPQIISEFASGNI